MSRRFMLRYLILIAFLALCAGAAWYRNSTSKVHTADTVLAKRENGEFFSACETMPDHYAMVRGTSGERFATSQKGFWAGYAALQRSFPKKYAVLQRKWEGAGI